MPHALKRRVAFLATAISVLLIANIAFAAWLSEGSGDGDAVATTQGDPTVDQTGSLTGLFPGKDDQELVINVASDNDYKTAVTSLVVTSITSDTTDCAGSNIEVADLTADTGKRVVQQDGGYVLAADSNDDYVLLVDMIDNPADECQGATFDVNVTATLESAEHSVTGQNALTGS